MEAAARHLASRPRSAAELKEHLLKKGFSEEDIDIAIVRLKESGYVNDVSYVCTYIRYGLSKRKAIFKIKYELRAKGVDESDIQEGIYMFEDEENADISRIEEKNAEKEASKYIKVREELQDELTFEEKEKRREIEKKERDKAARRLSSLGYNASLISSVLEKYR